MTSAADNRPGIRTGTGSRGLLWFAFVVVHLVLIVAALPKNGDIFNDVRLYGQWARGGLDFGYWPVLDYDWVYPIGALLPAVLPALFADSQNGYIALYVLLVVALDAIALWALLRAGRGRTLAAWWWLAFLLAAGPIVVSRLDGIASALTIIALAALAWPAGTLLAAPGRRSVLASTLATLGAWIKVAPGVVVLALACTVRRPWRRVIAPAAGVSAVLILLAWLGGAGGRVFGFATGQGTRGLQIESVPATCFSIARLWSTRYTVFFNQDIITWEITGPGTAAVASAADIALVLGVIATCALAVAASRRLGKREPAGLDEPDRPARHERTGRLDLILLTTMTLSLMLFVFDKVGSPQYVLWFAAPVAVALAVRNREARHARGSWDLWSTLAVGLLVVAALTQWLYPIAYNWFLVGRSLEVVIEAVRNLLTAGFAVMCLVALARWCPPSTSGAGDVESGTHEASEHPGVPPDDAAARSEQADATPARPATVEGPAATPRSGPGPQPAEWPCELQTP